MLYLDPHVHQCINTQALRLFLVSLTRIDLTHSQMTRTFSKGIYIVI